MKKKIIITTSIIVSLLVIVGVGLYFVLGKKAEKEEKTPTKVETVETYTIKFDSNGGSKVEDKKINKGEALTLPENPTKEGYTFVKWEDKNGTEIANGSLIDGNTTLIAVWEKAKSEPKTEKKQSENKTKTTKSTTKPKAKSSTTKPAVKPETTQGGEAKPVTYTCPSGYTLNGTKCTKTATKDATLVSETCPDGFDKNPTKCISQKNASTAKPTCPNGYTKRPGYLYCYEKVQSGLDEYTCKNYPAIYVNGQYTNGSCYYGNSVELKYTCPSGYYVYKIWGYSGPVDESNKCRELKDFIKNYSCESGYTLDGSKCVKTETIDATIK